MSVPQQDQVIDREDPGSGSLSDFVDSVLRVFQTEELLHFAKPRLLHAYAKKPNTALTVVVMQSASSHASGLHRPQEGS